MSLQDRIQQKRLQKLAAKQQRRSTRAARKEQKKGIYTVKSGDSWFKIAQRVYGDQAYGVALANSNPWIGGLSTGQKIRLPTVSDRSKNFSQANLDYVNQGRQAYYDNQRSQAQQGPSQQGPSQQLPAPGQGAPQLASPLPAGPASGTPNLLPGQNPPALAGQATASGAGGLPQPGLASPFGAGPASIPGEADRPDAGGLIYRDPVQAAGVTAYPTGTDFDPSGRRLPPSAADIRAQRWAQGPGPVTPGTPGQITPVSPTGPNPYATNRRTLTSQLEGLTPQQQARVLEQDAFMGAGGQRAFNPPGFDKGPGAYVAFGASNTSTALSTGRPGYNFVGRGPIGGGQGYVDYPAPVGKTPRYPTPREETPLGDPDRGYVPTPRGGGGGGRGGTGPGPRTYTPPKYAPNIYPTPARLARAQPQARQAAYSRARPQRSYSRPMAMRPVVRPTGQTPQGRGPALNISTQSDIGLLTWRV